MNWREIHPNPNCPHSPEYRGPVGEGFAIPPCICDRRVTALGAKEAPNAH